MRRLLIKTCILSLLIIPLLNANEIVFAANQKLVEQYVAQDIIKDIYQSIGLNLKVTPLPPKRALKFNLNKENGGFAKIVLEPDEVKKQKWSTQCKNKLWTTIKNQKQCEQQQQFFLSYS